MKLSNKNSTMSIQNIVTNLSEKAIHYLLYHYIFRSTVSAQHP